MDHNLEGKSYTKTVTLPPALSASVASQRRLGSPFYGKNYSRSSFEQQLQRRYTEVQPSDMDAKQNESQQASDKLIVQQHLELESPALSLCNSAARTSGAFESVESVIVSPMTTPNDSRVASSRQRCAANPPRTSGELRSVSVDCSVQSLASHKKSPIMPIQATPPPLTTAATIALPPSTGGPLQPTVVPASPPPITAEASTKMARSVSTTTQVIRRAAPMATRMGRSAATIQSTSRSRTAQRTSSPPAPRRVSATKVAKTTTSAAPKTSPGLRNQARSPEAATCEHLVSGQRLEVVEQLGQMESVLEYVAEVTTALAERRRCASPSSEAQAFRASVIPNTRGASETGESFPTSSQQDAGVSLALLPDLHEAASSLLSSFSKIEYAQLADEVDMPLLERKAVECSARVLRVVDGIERKLTSNEAAEVREAFTERRAVVEDLRRLIGWISQVMQQMVLLRSLAMKQDLLQVKEVLKQHTVSHAAMVGRQRELFDTAFRSSPFFSWLQLRWIPAMEAWQSVVITAQREADKGDIDGAILRSHNAATAITGLHEVLRHGETISAMIQTQITAPVQQVGKSIARKREAVQALKAAMQGTIKIAPLMKAIQALRGIPDISNGSSITATADKQLLERASTLLLRLQEAESLQRGMKAALHLQTQDLIALLELITKANEQLYLWELTQDEHTSQGVVSAGRTALERCRHRRSSERSSTTDSCTFSLGGSMHRETNAVVRWIGDCFPPSFSVHSLYLPHVLSDAWTVELTQSYADVCTLFVKAYMQQQAQRHLEQALHPGSIRGSFVHGFSPDTTMRRGSEESTEPCSTPRPQQLRQRRDHSSEAASVRDLPTSTGAEELMRRLHQAQEAGCSGPLIDEARSRLLKLQALRLKVHFEAQVRIFSIEQAEKADFPVIYEMLQAYCASRATLGSVTVADRKLRIQYRDFEGDYISLHDNQDWSIMLSDLVPHGSGGEKIELFCDYPLLPVAHGSEGPPSGLSNETASQVPPPAPHTSGASTPPPTSEKSANVFERLASSSAQKRTGTNAASPGAAQRQRTAPGRSGLLDGARSAAQRLASKSADLRRNVSPSTRDRKPPSDSVLSVELLRRAATSGATSQSGAEGLSEEGRPSGETATRSPGDHRVPTDGEKERQQQQQQQQQQQHHDPIQQWNVVNDLQLMELGTRASISAGLPGQQKKVASSTGDAACSKPCERGPMKSPRSTFTTTCCGNISPAKGSTADAMKKQPLPSQNDEKSTPSAPQAPTRLWSSDNFFLDEIRTVCSDTSARRTQSLRGRAMTSLPPRPTKSTTPQRLRRGARGTPVKQRPPLDEMEEHRSAEDYLAEMSVLQEANNRAIASRKQAWH